ncbi:MAG TPA: transketolase [Deltaproteobacteria bacterium]|nr:MAG: transketolase [Deltaproteobacteria bacterium GWA2_55_82]OGQ63139.1 MAG: transketolase [Deltaproteobacteria bacterium RIFCSPLOWO2_02_FULL_55_12]OIJ73604.1 MAG: transketolase [Deltaproteobacteria bacterium GWC2_55_46]HBG47741.1 transketolase [Deltaproteobacteria bacterium]HCY12037.1 transketolase [Deltaproteobacteria bacterium]
MRVEDLVGHLRVKSSWVRKETLRIHARAQETRIASSLSCVEILTVLYYGGIMSFAPEEPSWDGRDRLIVSKGHGAVSLYPILADLGYFDPSELTRVCKEGTFLGGIPDPVVPGVETVNGSLGHGLGVGAGMALALKRKGMRQRVFVLAGDGELYEGSVWEAVMFAPHHKLDNLVLIIDANKACMLDFCDKVLDIEPIEEKLRAFGWEAASVDGHDVKQLYQALFAAKADSRTGRPRAIVARTVKGKGVPSLESDPLSHVKNVSATEAESIIEGMR